MRLLLAFLHQATSPRRYPQLHRHVYSMGTGLQELNRALPQRPRMPCWPSSITTSTISGGGTCLGDAWHSWRCQQARHLVGRRTLVLLVSDGWILATVRCWSGSCNGWRGTVRALSGPTPLLRFDGYALLASLDCCIVTAMPCWPCTTCSRCSNWLSTWRSCCNCLTEIEKENTMEMHASRPLAVSQQQAWEALNDPQTLQQCPGRLREVRGCRRWLLCGDHVREDRSGIGQVQRPGHAVGRCSRPRATNDCL